MKLPGVAEACPICGADLSVAKPPPRLRPFCSQRCADVDLGRWFTGQYRVPSRPEAAEEDGGEGA